MAGKTGVSLTRTDIESIAKRLISIKIWVEEYGKPLYNLRRPESTRKFLAAKSIAEWEVIQFDRKWYVFLNTDNIGRKEEKSRNKLSPSEVQRIKETDYKIKGTQSKLAAELGLQQSHVSRIRRGIAWANLTAPRDLTDEHKRTFSDERKQVLFVSKIEIESFFNIMLTAKNFVDLYGEKYGIKSPNRVYDMCAGRNYAKLPEHWSAVRASDTWLVYNTENIS